MKHFRDVLKDYRVAAERLKTLTDRCALAEQTYQRHTLADPDRMSPEQLLQDCDGSARVALATLLGTHDPSPVHLIKRLASLTQSLIGRALHEPPTYGRVVELTCKRLRLRPVTSVCDGERAIVTHCFKTVYDRLSPSERLDLEKAVQARVDTLENVSPSYAAPAVTAAAILAGQASGFGVFAAASTLVGALTHAIGITLPFVFYTTMSSAIAVAIGPVGWVFVAGMIVNRVFGQDYKKVVSGILLIASLRGERAVLWKLTGEEMQQDIRRLQRERWAAQRELFYCGAVVGLYVAPIIVLLIALILLVGR